ncbi:unnamed protein product [Vitrella brassicaformis CCMP3155]|uniref:Uncharacterized protein n=1 Tax=Vitrella brassicaformis (strain CCMP3155) TaxID=1169540 RepID=A0A0G4FC68_VITBC|nr:unnamed protein product [Vitrella brassicaformis CCMP3155]|eukprot:CEM10252.1 unnamed protein product [Vitrella brassicaformis CCMP3155]
MQSTCRVKSSPNSSRMQRAHPMQCAQEAAERHRLEAENRRLRNEIAMLKQQSRSVAGRSGQAMRWRASSSMRGPLTRRCSHS